MLGKHGMSFKPFTLLFNRLHLTLHPSSIPWNSLCLSGFQRLMGTIPPFITLHFYKDLSRKRFRVYTIVAFSFIRTFAP